MNSIATKPDPHMDIEPCRIGENVIEVPKTTWIFPRTSSFEGGSGMRTAGCDLQSDHRATGNREAGPFSQVHLKTDLSLTICGVNEIQVREPSTIS
jgi:hypothetical protein